MLKLNLTQNEFDALASEFKGHYKLEGDTYVLQLEGAEALINAKQREKERADTLQQELNALKDSLRTKEAEEAEARRLAAEEAARKAGDFAALEQSYKDRLEAAEKNQSGEVTRLTKMIETILVDKEAEALANAISTAPRLMIPIIKERLRAEINGDTAITRVLDASGKPSAANIADLKAELIANKEFSAIIRGSNASGGGASEHKPGGSAGGDKKISDMTETERVAFYRADPDAYKTKARAEGLSVN